MSKVEDALLGIGINPEEFATAIESKPGFVETFICFLQENRPDTLLQNSEIVFPEMVTRIITPEQFCKRTFCHEEKYPAFVPNSLFRNIRGRGEYTAVPVPRLEEVDLSFILRSIKNRRITNINTLQMLAKIQKERIPEYINWIVFGNTPSLIKRVFEFRSNEETETTSVRLERFFHWKKSVREKGFFVPDLVTLLMVLELTDTEHLCSIPPGTYVTQTFLSEQKIFGNTEKDGDDFHNKNFVAMVAFGGGVYGIEILHIHEAPQHFLFLPVIDW